MQQRGYTHYVELCLKNSANFMALWLLEAVMHMNLRCLYLTNKFRLKCSLICFIHFSKLTFKYVTFNKLKPTWFKNNWSCFGIYVAFFGFKLSVLCFAGETSLEKRGNVGMLIWQYKEKIKIRPGSTQKVLSKRRYNNLCGCLLRISIA